MPRDLITRIHAAAAQLGVEILTIDTAHRHPRVVFRIDGRTHRYVIPGTPSDWRSIMNNVAGFRRYVRQLRARAA